MPGTRDWCLRWEVRHHSAKPWDRIRHAIAVFIHADDFYEGSGYECDSGVVDTFQSEWTERICVERNPDYVDPRPANDWLPRLAPSNTPLLRLLNSPPSGNSVIRWNWGTLKRVEPIVSEPPSVDQQPPPAGATMDGPD